MDVCGRRFSAMWIIVVHVKIYIDGNVDQYEHLAWLGERPRSPDGTRHRQADRPGKKFREKTQTFSRDAIRTTPAH